MGKGAVIPVCQSERGFDDIQVNSWLPTDTVQRYNKGLLLAGVIAAAATCLSPQYSAPVTLFAMLIGMAFHFVHEDPQTAARVDFVAKTLLCFGIGLMGLRLTVSDVTTLGDETAPAVAAFMLLTLGFGVLLSFHLGRQTAFGLLAGGSGAICGASAALAIAFALSKKVD